jgi:MtN3 and saliva related transmembrane protein
MQTEIIAVIATILVVVSWIPQLIKAYTTKSLKDFSYWFVIIVILATLAWIIYGIAIQDSAIIIGNSVILLFPVLLLIMKFYYDRKK